VSGKAKNMEALMERIRGRADQMRTLADTAKVVRIGLADRRHSLDIQDKVHDRHYVVNAKVSITIIVFPLYYAKT
jgi:hypothetical protein